MSCLKLYKQRYKRWKAETGSVEWHTATAEIRAYNGDSLSAAIHFFMATLKNALEGFGEMVSAYLDAGGTLPRR